MRTGDWFQTYSGTQFYLTDPHPDDVAIEDIAHALGMACRFGGHTREFYSVGQHSVHVSELLEKWGEPLSMQLHGLLHDASEAYLGDVVRPLKYAMPDYRDYEQRMMEVIYEALKLDYPGPLEHSIIKRADDILLMTERRDLITHRNIKWSITADSLEEEILPWTPVAAEVQFNLRYYHLTRKLAGTEV
jgi:5'-deoxynucleotidase YfbR-like HD superfamily hydrolase